MKKINLFALLFIAMTLVFVTCGSNETEQAGKPEATKTGERQPAEDEGVTVAKAILAAFDQAVAEVYELVKDKPEAGEVKPRLHELYLKYQPKMQELNVQYLALKEKDIALFGSANRYLGEYRGKHVWQEGQKLDAIRFHYQGLKDQEMDSLVHQELINLLDLAVKR